MWLVVVITWHSCIKITHTHNTSTYLAQCLVKVHEPAAQPKYILSVGANLPACGAPDGVVCGGAVADGQVAPVLGGKAILAANALHSVVLCGTVA